MAVSDIRLSVDFFQHPKTIKLERRLGIEGVKALLSLWMWDAQNRPDGVLSGMDPEDIEIAAGWTRSDQDLDLVSTLVASDGSTRRGAPGASTSGRSITHGPPASRAGAIRRASASSPAASRRPTPDTPPNTRRGTASARRSTKPSWPWSTQRNRRLARF